MKRETAAISTEMLSATNGMILSELERAVNERVVLEVDLAGLLKEAERAERTEVVAVVAGMAELHLVVLRCALKQSHEELEQTHVFVRKLHRG